MIRQQEVSGAGRAGWHRRSVAWLVAAAGCLALYRIVPSGVWDKGYYQGLFPIWRSAYDTLLGWSPLPFVYVLLAVILYRTARWWAGRHRGWRHQASRALGGMAAVVVFFYVLWGFNYRQLPMQKRLGYDLDEVTHADIEAEFARATEALRAEAAGLPAGLATDDAIRATPVHDHGLRPDVVAALAELGLPHRGQVRVRQLWPRGLLLRWSTAGVYVPQASEGHVDPGLTAVQKPFTMAHEMAHGYGVTDEGACNFIAWMACTRSRDPWVRYSGLLGYWRYVAAEMPRDTVSRTLEEVLPPVVSRSIALIKENDRKYPDFLPRFRDLVYGTYLRHHGVHGGLRSYNYVVLMVQRYIARHHGLVPAPRE